MRPKSLFGTIALFLAGLSAHAQYQWPYRGPSAPVVQTAPSPAPSYPPPSAPASQIPAPAAPYYSPLSALPSLSVPPSPQAFPMSGPGAPQSSVPDRAPAPIPDVERLDPAQPPEMAWVSPPDNHRLWFTADCLMWWVKGAPMPQALVTAGSATDPVPGALGQPNTRVLFGQHTFDFGPACGLRLGIGGWLDTDHLWALEGSVFALVRKDRRALFGSDSGGDLVLGQPVIDPLTGAERAYVSAFPGLVAGTVLASTSTQVAGWEINGMRNLSRSDNLEINLLGGFREVIVRETLTVASDVQQLQPNVLSFAGKPIYSGDRLFTWDNFRADTHFYGPQLGGKLSWSSNRLGVDLVGKLALGVSHEAVGVNGATWLISPAYNSITAIPGGILAQSSNIGWHSRDVFAVAPEANLNLHYDLRPWARLNFGYSFIYLSRIVRPGLVVDRTVDPGRVPSDPAFGQGTTSNSPSFGFHDGGFWAQGLNFGVILRY